MPATPAAERDAHSYAVPSDARVTHVALDLTADFAAHVLAGHATLTIEAVPTATGAGASRGCTRVPAAPPS